jgi:citrate synthase
VYYRSVPLNLLLCFCVGWISFFQFGSEFASCGFYIKICRFCVKENMEQVDRHAMERRMTILAGHLEQPFFSGTQQQQLEASIVSAEIAPSPGGGAGTLSVIDNRTGKRYQLEISDAGTVKATDFKKITAGGDGNGLKLYDPGYLNTAPVRSSISYIDGDQGILRYRGYPIEELAEKSSYLEVAYLLMYGNLPTKLQLSDWEATIAQHSAVPQGVLVCLFRL